MIGRVLPRGANVRGVLGYLFGPGKKPAVHASPHLVASWDGDPAGLEPPRRADGRRSFTRLAGLLQLPVQLAGGKVAGKFVYHVAVRCAPGDPDLGDGAWQRIATEIMHRTGLSVRGCEDQGVRWVAVRHAPDHIHIVATLAGQDRRPAWPRNDFYRIGEALRDLEREYGLQMVGRADRTAARGLSRAEWEQRHAGGEPDRAVLYRQVRAAAAAARSEEEFFAGLAARGLKVRLRESAVRPGEVTGYAVAVDHGPGRREVWYGGGKLAADLTLPKLRRRWAGPRLSGRGMGDPPARDVLAREVTRAARAARTEEEFFALLERAGLQVRLRPGPARPGGPAAGYAVTLPGLAGPAGQPAWYAGGALDPGLRLGVLRARWRAGQPGAGPGPEAFAGASRAWVYEHAARAAGQAARDMATDPSARPDIAWAAADVLTAAAEVTGNPALSAAAEGFTRAARAAWGRTPPPAPAGAMLRTAAYLLGSCRRPGPARAARRMFLALAALARALAELRAAQARRAQLAAALSAAAGLDDIAAAIGQASAAMSPAAAAAAAFPRPPQATPPAPGRRPRTPRPPRAGRSPGR